MRRTSRWLGGLLACALASAALAQGGDAVTRVDAYLATVNTLSAGFSQVVRNRDNQVVDRTGSGGITKSPTFRSSSPTASNSGCTTATSSR